MTEEGLAQLAQCAGKESYNSRPLAEKVAKRRNQRNRRLNVYKCPHCRTWHMGSIVRNPRR